MRKRNSGRRTRTGLLLAAVALAALAGTAGCGGGVKEPHKGQAVGLASWGDDSDEQQELTWKDLTALDGVNESADGLAYGSDGKLYVLGATDALRLDADGTVHAAGPDGLVRKNRRDSGLAAEPGGTFLTGRGRELVRWRPGGVVQPVTAFSAHYRTPGSAVPASAAIGSVGAWGTPTPLGYRPDGSLVMVDGDVVWSFKDGRLTRLFQVSASGDKQYPNDVDEHGAVNRSGTVWLVAGAPAPLKSLAGLRTVAPDGTVGHPALPRKIRGVPEDPATLGIFWLADDGADGVYAHVYSSTRELGSHDYVLHLRPGSARLVAKEAAHPSWPCAPSRPVEALALPCTLPWAMVQRAGRLTMAGNTTYALTVALT